MSVLCEAALCIFTALAPVDGDTFDAGDGGWLRVRLWGVDTPERGEPGHDAATDALTELVGEEVMCEWRGERTFGRPVMQCWNNADEDVACELLADGHGVELTEYSHGYYETCRSE